VADEQHRAAPPSEICLHLAEAALLESASPTARTSSTIRISGPGGRDREGQPHVHAGGIALHGRVEELLDLGESDDVVELGSDLAPLHAEDRAVQEDVLAAAQLLVKAGADLEQRATRPRRMARPSVGSVMRERILSSVLLPAPFRPTMPTTSPARTES
jgi:hypothetical protein